MIEDPHERCEEDNRREHLEREKEPKTPRRTDRGCKGTKNELSTIGGKTKETYKAFADCCKDNVADGNFENEKGENKLHHNPDDHEPPIDGALVGREEKRNSGYEDETDQPADDRKYFHAAASAKIVICRFSANGQSGIKVSSFR